MENPDRLAQAANSLREILANLPKSAGVSIKEVNKTSFVSKRDKIKSCIESAKKNHYPKGWNGEIKRKLRKALETLEEYLALNDGPTRHENTTEAILKSNPVHEYSPKRRLELLAAGLGDCDAILQKFTHHTLAFEHADLFSATVENFEKLLLQVFSPPAVEVQRALRKIVEKDPSTESKTSVQQILVLLKKRPADYEFFFKSVRSPAWLKTLDEGGFFSNPAPIKKLENNYVQVPSWHPMAYLVTVAGLASKKVVAICRRIPRTDNPRVYADIMKVAMAVGDIDVSVKLLSKIKEGVRARNHPFTGNFGELIAHWSTSETGVAAALNIAADVLSFDPDPRAKEKVKRRSEKNPGLYILLEPVAKFESYSYQRIVTEGLVPLAVKAPCLVALLLIRTLRRHIDLKFHKPDEAFRLIKGDDHSSIWCQRVHGHQDMHREQPRSLAHALTAVCEAICTRADPSELTEMDEALRAARWKVFKRIRHYLYAKFPTLFRDQIRDCILGYPDYRTDEYGRERAQMIQVASQHFGTELLTTEEYDRIIAEILAGPDYDNFKTWAREDFSEAAFQDHRNYFHRQQLWPFASILRGEGQRRLVEASAALQSPPPSIDEYSPVIMQGHDLRSESPVPEDELEKMPDAQMIELFNHWDQRRRDPNRWWVTIDLDGLVGAFGRCFKKHPARFAGWTEQWNQLERPIFLRAVLELGIREVEAKEFGSLATWLHVCHVALSKPVPHNIDRQELSEDSAAKPRWERVRSTVQRFLSVCLKAGSGFPAPSTPTLLHLLENLCLGPDTSLDQPDSYHRSNNEPISTAINTTRGQAIELFHGLVFSLRRSDSEFAPQAHERFKAVIDLRFAGQPPLTDPELALLGLHAQGLLSIDRAWGENRVGEIYGHEPLSRWLNSFGSFLRFSHAPHSFWETFRLEYEFGVSDLSVLRTGTPGNDDARESALNSLGMHLFSFYLWGRYSLSGPGSLLEAFIEQATPKELEVLLRNVGEFVGQVPLREEQKSLAQAFLDSRIASAETAGFKPTEFQSLYGWLKNEKLPSEWRLRSFLRLLNIGMPVDAAALYVECLLTMLNGQLELVLECFLKISEHAKSPSFYIDPAEGLVIIRAGSASGNPLLVALADQAREYLVGAGHSAFLDE